MEQLIKLYKLKTNHWELKHLSNNFERIQFIVDRHRKLTEKHNEVGIPVPHLYYKRLHFHLYNFNVSSSVSSWKKFFPPILTGEQEFATQTPSFVLFAHDKKVIFVIVGGSGSHAIKRYFDFNFGLDMTTRIITPDTDIVHFAEVRGITGNIAGKAEMYRKDQKIYEIDSFGKIFKKILFELNNEVLKEQFHVDIEKIRKSKVMSEASKGFSIRTALDFDRLCVFIHDCIDILDKQEKIQISTFVPVLDEEYVFRSINISLFKTIQDRLKAKTVERATMSFFDYDFCHPEKILQFYECDEYLVYGKHAKDPFWRTDDKTTIFDSVLDYTRENIDISSLKNIMSFLGGVKVRGIKNGTGETHAPFMSHLSCEIFHKDRNVFKIDDQWFEIRGNFIQQLNQECRLIFANHGVSGFLNEVWINPDHKDYSEDWYNKQYLEYGDFFVLDKVLSQNIELCDLLFITEGELFLFHVKKGFNGMMRDLTNQVTISARRLWIDIKTKEKPFLAELYDSFSRSDNFLYTYMPSKEEFIELFLKNKITYVISFCSMNKTGRRVFREVETFRSNIAKYSLTEAIKEMKDQEFGIKILEIEHKFE
jgi:uncharacterized protein (TIGR04141 family)